MLESLFVEESLFPSLNPFGITSLKIVNLPFDIWLRRICYRKKPFQHLIFTLKPLLLLKSGQ